MFAIESSVDFVSKMTLKEMRHFQDEYGKTSYNGIKELVKVTGLTLDEKTRKKYYESDEFVTYEEI